MVVIRSLIFALCFISAIAKEGVFYGVSISYELEAKAGKNIAYFTLFTSWKLGEGPCGVNCSENDVGIMTNIERTRIEQVTGNSVYFGTFSTDYSMNRSTYERNLDPIVRSNYSEWVTGVNEQEMWEQERMQFSFEMKAAHEDFNFNGKYWRPLLNRSKLPWHITTRLTKSLRSDTKRMNNSPQVVLKPFYRVKLNKNSTIQIPAIDPDHDVVRCSKANFVDGGNLPYSQGVTVHQNEVWSTTCQVSVDASMSLGYRDNTWIAVPLTFRDYPSNKIQFGNDVYQPGIYSLSGIPAQILVQIVENLDTPVFVSPTMKGGQLFIVYAGATWTTDICAQASLNRTLVELLPFGRNRETVIVSKMKTDSTRQRVKCSTMSWVPSLQDIGQHILCIRAVDNTGVEAEELRCFIVDVSVKTFNHSSTVYVRKPYFVDIPSSDQSVSCQLDATCLIPLLVKSSSMVTFIQIFESSTDEAVVGKPHVVSHKGEAVYETSLSFKHSMPGTNKICLIATDVNNVTSDKVCINLEIEYPVFILWEEFCINQLERREIIDANRTQVFFFGVMRVCPHLAETALLVKSNRSTGLFMCECLSNGFYGRFCEHIKNPCDDRPCIDSHTQQCINVRGPMMYFCWCMKGFEGKHCEITNTTGVSPVIASTSLPETSSTVPVAKSTILVPRSTTTSDPCRTNPCVRGTCFSHAAMFLCECPHGSTGKLCEKTVDPCEPNPCVHGICFSHDQRFLCQCSSGFTGKMCEKTDVQGPSIVG